MQKKTIVHETFQGMLEITTRKLPPTEKDDHDIDMDSPEYVVLWP